LRKQNKNLKQQPPAKLKQVFGMGKHETLGFEANWETGLGGSSRLGLEINLAGSGKILALETGNFQVFPSPNPKCSPKQ